MSDTCHCDKVTEAVLPVPARPKPALRLRGLAIAASCWAVLCVAWSLTPQPGGVGTHEQLNLPACSFMARTGWPCPTCGLTTSLSATTHGNVIAAWQAQPFGLLLAPAILLLAVTGTIELISGRDAIGALRPRVWWAWAAIAGMLAGWGGKIAMGVAAGRLPLR
ncbi:MAG: DUF2752 domain-containing protein [Planctomycetota bacterium]|nr:DUF2752 domain-containing protein [Planctomycetota bacterium]